MKKKSILNLIKYYSEKNDAGFRSEAYQIAKDFDEAGDYQLSEYIMALLSSANTFVPQINDNFSSFFRKEVINKENLVLPEVIFQDFMGVLNAISHNAGINKFLFKGKPGTGKTEAVKHLARILERDLFSVDFSSIIDSKLGQTQKNITLLFNELNSFSFPDKLIVLFDEIDAIALDRTNSNDLREMGRATSTILRELDKLDDRIVLVATTNLYEHFDKALIRRFDSVIDFDRYSIEDLYKVAETILNSFLNKFKFAGKNMKLFKKIIMQMDPELSPGELKNVIKTSIAFSDINSEYDYLKRLYNAICSNASTDLKVLQQQGYTVREIEILTNISKSQVARELKEGFYE